MTLTVEEWKKYRSRFAWVFAISFVVFVISMLSFFGQPTEVAYESPSPQESPHLVPAAKPNPPQLNLAALTSVASLVSSGIGIVGIVITTAIAWRKERREQQQGNIDLEIKRLQLERLRSEDERKKPDSSSST